jgi:topoisomerase-4 subunit A
VKFKEAGKSTLAGKKMWFDDVYGRLNTDEKGTYLGMFEPEDKIIVVYDDGSYEITGQELTQRFDPEKIMMIERFDPEKVITAVYLDNEKLQYNIKRFKIETSTMNSRFVFIKEGKGNRLEAVTTNENPVLKVTTGRGQQQKTTTYKVSTLIDVMGWKAVGSKLTDFSKAVEMEWEENNKNDIQGDLFNA